MVTYGGTPSAWLGERWGLVRHLIDEAPRVQARRMLDGFEVAALAGGRSLPVRDVRRRVRQLESLLERGTRRQPTRPEAMLARLAAMGVAVKRVEGGHG